MTPDEKIAKMEMEKLMLATIIEELEKWIYGECDLSERMKAKIAIARSIMNPTDETKAAAEYFRMAMYKHYEESKKKANDGRRKKKSPTA